MATAQQPIQQKRKRADSINKRQKTKGNGSNSRASMETKRLLSDKGCYDPIHEMQKSAL